MINFNPKTLTELHSILDTENVIIFANGTFLEEKYKNFSSKPYIFISGIDELKYVNFIDVNTLSVGTLLSVSHLLELDYIPIPIKAVLKLLNKASSIGGLICNTNSKILPILYSYNVYLELNSSKGSRFIPIEDFYKDNKIVLKKEEFLKNIILPLPKINNFIYISDYEIDLFILYKTNNNRIKDIRISFYIDTVIRSKFIENMLIGSDYLELETKFDMILNHYINELSLAAKQNKAQSLKLLLRKELSKIF